MRSCIPRGRDDGTNRGERVTLHFLPREHRDSKGAVSLWQSPEAAPLAGCGTESHDVVRSARG